MGKGSALSAWQPDAGLLTRLVVLDDGRVEQRSLSNCARSAIEYRNGCGPWAGTKVLEDLTRDGCSARLVTDIIAADFCPRPPRSPRRRRNGNGGACWFIRRCCGRVRARSLRLDPRRLLRKRREPRCRWRRRRSGRSGRRLRRRRLGWLSVSVCPSIDTGPTRPVLPRQRLSQRPHRRQVVLLRRRHRQHQLCPTLRRRELANPAQESRTPTCRRSGGATSPRSRRC
jgi:hypothetical protein